MQDIPGTVFQRPGGDRLGGTPETPNKPTDSTAAPGVSGEPGKDTADSEARQSGKPSSKSSQSKLERSSRRRSLQFAVEHVKPHPVALATARRIIEANPTYTKILPGDEPGSVIIR